MKKKIVIATRYMMMGGIERALLSLLEQLPKDTFDVTLLIVHPGGELYDQIPSHVNVKLLFPPDRKKIDVIREMIRVFFHYFRRGRILRACEVFLHAGLIMLKQHSEFKAAFSYSKTQAMGEEQYDVAISYSATSSLPVVYVAKNIRAKKKILWIHSDVSKLLAKKNEKFLKKLTKLYDEYDEICCVSQYALDRFSEKFPALKLKARLFYNIIDGNKMIRFAKEGSSFSDSFSGIRILTIGRLAEEKGQDIIPNVLTKLTVEGYDVRWYLIGDGPLRPYLESVRKERSLSNRFILLGTIDNPFPYLRDCDIYVQPSRHESFCLTVAEAKALKKPIICTNTGAKEQIIHGKTGLIVEFDEQEIYQALKNLIDKPVLKNSFIQNVSKETIDSRREMKKFYEMVQV